MRIFRLWFRDFWVFILLHGVQDSAAGEHTQVLKLFAFAVATPTLDFKLCSGT